MRDDTFLLLLYFVVGAGCVSAGILCYEFLRPAAQKIFALLGLKDGARVLCRSFPITMTLSALLGFSWVPYIVSCTPHDNYAAVVSDRVYLIEVGYKQISATADFLMAAIGVWSLILIFVLRSIRRQASKPKSDLDLLDEGCRKPDVSPETK
jgi:hypothetical protein